VGPSPNPPPLAPNPSGAFSLRNINSLSLDPNWERKRNYPRGLQHRRTLQKPRSVGERGAFPFRELKWPPEKRTISHVAERVRLMYGRPCIANYEPCGWVRQGFSLNE
jgi:hypothetical protein